MELISCGQAHEGFTPSVYVDNGIFLGNDGSKLQDTIRNIQDAGLNIEDQGHPADYVGVNIKKAKDGTYEFAQWALINSIIQDIRFKDAKVKPVPAKVSQRLHTFNDEPSFDLDFNYRSAVGKLNYLAQTTRPVIMYATHQVAKYSLDPRQSHGEAILYLVCYLKKTCNIGLKFTSNAIVTLIFLDFGTRNLRQEIPVQPSHELDGLSSMQDVPFHGLPNFNLRLYFRYVTGTLRCHSSHEPATGNEGARLTSHCNEPSVYCKVFEDKSGALELARLPKIRPRTKHINVCCHQFCEHVRKGLIKIIHQASGTK
jgi:hypothetical protein